VDNVNEIKHKLLVDTVDYSEKPDKKEINKINKRLPKSVVQITIREFAELVVIPYGRTFCCAYLEGSRRINKNWKSQSIFALDFDSGITFLAVLDRLKEYKLDCTLAYSTFSSNEQIPKFRVIFQLDEVITDLELRNSIQYALIALFPECDKLCKDPSRMFYGGKEIIHNNYNYFLNIPQLLESTRMYVAENATNLSQSLNRLDKKTKKLEKCYKNGSAYNNIIETSRFITKSEENIISSELIRVDWDELRKKIKILDDFMNGEWLYHMELFGLATNLIHIRGGEKLFKECLDKNSKYSKGKYNLPGLARYYKYNPMRLENFSNYEEARIYKNLIEASGKKKVIRLVKYNTESLQLLRNEFSKLFSDALESQDTFIHVFKAATGIGKTEVYTNSSNLLIALPNYSLIAEVSERMRVKHKITTSQDNLPNEVQKRLEYLYSIGDYTEATAYLKEMALTNPACAEYIENNQACYESSDTVITTHQKGIFMRWLHDTLIFDEDIISSLLLVGKVYMNELIRLEANITNSKDKSTLNQIIDGIRCRHNIPTKLNFLSFENWQGIKDEVLDGNVRYNSNLLQFFECDYYIVDFRDINTIYYIKKLKLPENKKIIILSATAIAVVGTPHIHPIVTSLYANVLGIELSAIDFNKKGLYNFKQQQVTHNGFQFWISTYDNKDLRTIHFHFIESELRQAVGRARHNTEPATVKLFSNYPLPEACINDEEIKVGRQKLDRYNMLKNKSNFIKRIYPLDLKDLRLVRIKPFIVDFSNRKQIQTRKPRQTKISPSTITRADYMN